MQVLPATFEGSEGFATELDTLFNVLTECRVVGVLGGARWVEADPLHICLGTPGVRPDLR